MKVLYRASFAKDLRGIKSKEILSRIKEAIEQVEKAQSLQEITSIKKLKGGRNYYRIRSRVSELMMRNKESRTSYSSS